MDPQKGEQKMLVIGRALMVRPDLLIMDELFIMLSPIMVHQIGEMIIDINLR
jgi:ABC-type branched-subunit amino acid transport system ATPase component